MQFYMLYLETLRFFEIKRANCLKSLGVNKAICSNRNI